MGMMGMMMVGWAGRERRLGNDQSPWWCRVGSGSVTPGNAAKQPETGRNVGPFPAIERHKDAGLTAMKKYDGWAEMSGAGRRRAFILPDPTVIRGLVRIDPHNRADFFAV